MADRATKKRKRDLQEFVFECVLGAKKQGRSVLYKLQWEGGKERWGTAYQTWTTLPPVVALGELGNNVGLKGNM